MAQPVWVLSVDLQAKTATFQTGMSDAARSARGAFDEIGNAAGQGGRRVGSGMTEARHSVMMLGEEFGVHIPRALATFIAGLGPIGGALEAAFPFLAIVVGATLLIEHLEKIRESGEKLTDDQVKFGTAANNAFNQLTVKLLEAQKRADELRGDHLGALSKELDLIDRQSMAELVKSFEEVAKAADVVMKDLEGHWYTWGKGSDGAEAALNRFQTQYDNLLARGKQEDASGLLSGTLKQAQEVLYALQHSSDLRSGHQEITDDSYAAQVEAAKTLDKYHVQIGLDLKDQTAAQQQLVDALQAQLRIEGQVAELKKLDSGNTQHQTGNEMAAQHSAAARAAAESQLRMGEQGIAADKATADAQLEIHRASIEERLSSDIDFAGRERDVQLAGNAAEIAALDKSGKDYQNQLKALNEKALEINGEYDTKIAELKAKASVEMYDRDLQNLEQGIRGQIEATQEGSTARVAAIDAGLREAQAHQLQDTEFYRELSNQRIEAARREAEEEQKISDQKTAAQIDGVQRAAEEQIKHRTAQIKTQDGGGSMQDLSRVAQERQIEDMTYALQKQALQQDWKG